MIHGLRIAFGLAAAVVVSLVFLVFHLVVRRFGNHAARIMPHVWARTCAWLLDLRISIVGDVTRARPLLLVANHVSWADIIVMGAIAPFNFVAKADMARWPGLGALARAAGTVFVERERRARSGSQANALSARLVAGEPVVLFAEGSTSNGNEPLPFKSTLIAAAQIALENNGDRPVLVQPVSIIYVRQHGVPLGRIGRARLAWYGDGDLAPHLFALLGEGSIDVEVRFGDPVAFSASSDRKAVTRELERRVADMMVSSQRGNA